MRHASSHRPPRTFVSLSRLSRILTGEAQRYSCSGLARDQIMARRPLILPKASAPARQSRSAQSLGRIAPVPRTHRPRDRRSRLSDSELLAVIEIK